MESKRLMAAYVAFLRSLYLIHQHSHWTARGQNFYEAHLMLQRLYETVQAHVDQAAEKAIGVFGPDALPASDQAKHINKILLKYTDSSPILNSFEAEKDFMKLSSNLYKHLEKEGKLTLGLDDMIMAIASEHETLLYLLQQTISTSNL